MRSKVEGEFLVAKAIAGTDVVVLAWDFAPDRFNLMAQRAEDQNLLGFAVERACLGENGELEERGWLRGIKRFEKKDPGTAPGTLMPTSEHPIQSFQWADYTVDAGQGYTYRVVPVYGKPKLLTLAEDEGVEVEVKTEPRAALGDGVRHDVFFNRGVIGSQAYARRFDNAEPDKLDPHSEEMKWLSRGLFEALIEFIEQATGPEYSLRAAFYEFHYPHVARAFRAAVERSADVKIVYDAESSYKATNNETIDTAGLRKYVVPRTVSEGIRHNKFIVLLKNDEPVAVWTGSTNISPGGIFGHSNVGHVVHDPDIANDYLAYWDRLAENLTSTKLRKPNRDATTLPKGPPWKAGTVAVFSPRDDNDSPSTLEWYANRMAEAERIVCFTVAFTIDPLFQAVLQENNDVLRYVVKDDDLSTSENIGTDKDVVFAAGGFLDDGALVNFLKERDNPLNSNDYIHTKYMLVDPLSDNPLVVTGSANFSNASQRNNDENMLVIRGDTRVADIYFGEFLRTFDHHYARYVVKKMRRAKKGLDGGGGYLKVKMEEWLPPHLEEDDRKSKRRRYFVE
ncbi:phospholipase D-like domain-containing protein [Piscinibacter gummiphilus]|uniref:phospholipase D n=1 Tax=Piscinibacter gummiphilus TaxID=946333 RepID=A0ABZ0D295_9BURK|nr:phospholipase D-like domain-containing protein [Piscinibacter gummiphilus]WOB11313.1 phospholipase D-like domain-containing protein [Piscinibacter gummiphilus]